MNKLIVNKDIRKQILNDIERLQLCKSEDIFERASVLFIHKWREIATEFVKYFFNE